MAFLILLQGLTGLAISSCLIVRVMNPLGNPSLAVCLRGWLSEAKAFLELRPVIFPLTVLPLSLCRIITSSLILTEECMHTLLSLFLHPTEIIRAERINVRDVSTNSATLQWRPVLSGLTGHYEIRFAPVRTGGAGVGGGAGTSPSTGGSQYQRLIQGADSSTARLTGLKPDTTYTATLTPESNEQAFNPLSVTFTTKPGWVTVFFYMLCYNNCAFHLPFTYLFIVILTFYRVPLYLQVAKTEIIWIISTLFRLHRLRLIKHELNT